MKLTTYLHLLSRLRMVELDLHFCIYFHGIKKDNPYNWPWSPTGFESRLPHFLDNLLTDAGEVVSPTCRLAALYPQEDSWYSFLLETESTLGP
jgi:hypothetical protein